MLEPLTALGLAGNVVQLVDFAASLLKESYRIVGSAANRLPANAQLGELATAQRAISERIDAYDLQKRPLDAEETAVQDAVQRCTGKASDLIALLERLEVPYRSDGSLSRRKQITVVLKTRMKRAEIETLSGELEAAQNTLTAALLSLLRYMRSYDQNDMR